MAVAAGLGMMLASLDFSVNVALPAMRDAFDADLAAVQWVIVVFIATRAGLALGAGAFADRFGLRSVYLFGAAAYVVAMVCLALSPSLAVMVGFRVVQAVGTGCLYSAAPAIAAAVFPERRRGLSMGFTSASLALGMVTSTLAAGPLVAAFDWPAIYAGRIPLAVPALLIGALVAPGRRAPPTPAAANTTIPDADAGSLVTPTAPASAITSNDANGSPAMPPILASSTISDANGNPATPSIPASAITSGDGNPTAPASSTISDDAADNPATPPIPVSAITSNDANANPAAAPVPAPATASDAADNPATPPVPASVFTSDHAASSPAEPPVPASAIASDDADGNPATPPAPASSTTSNDDDGNPATPAVPASAIASYEADSSPAAPAVPALVAISEDAAGSPAAPAVPASGVTSDSSGGSPAPAVSTSAGTGGGADGGADAGRMVPAAAPAGAGETGAAGAPAGQTGQAGEAGQAGRAGPDGPAGRFDLAGAALVLSVMVCLMIGLRLGQAIGWGAAPVVALLTAAPALLVILIRVERRAAAPVLPGALLRLPGFQTAVGAMFLGHFSQFAIWFIFPFYITDALGRGPVTLGVMLATMSCCNILSAPAGGWLCDRWGVRPVGSIGLALTAAGLLAMSLLDGGSAIWHPAAGIAVVGLGVGWFQSAAYALMLGSVPAARFGTASGAMSLAQASGTVFCVSVVGAIFAALNDYYAGAGAGVGVGVGDPFLLAYRDVFRIGAGTAALSTIAFALRARQPGGQRG